MIYTCRYRLAGDKAIYEFHLENAVSDRDAENKFHVWISDSRRAGRAIVGQELIKITRLK